jgi:2-dehydropantoate 2-reductase
VRFIIYGTGAVGGTIGARLALNSHPVVLVDLPGPVQVLREHGLRFESPQGTHVLHLPTAASAAEVEFRDDDVVLLCVMSQHTETAMRELGSAVTDVPIFCFQNGVRNEEIAARSFDRVYSVMVRGTSICLRHGEVVNPQDPPGAFLIGRFPTGVDQLAESAADVLHALDYGVLVVPDVMPYKWGKLLRNLRNAVGAITDTAYANTVQITEAARKEACSIMERAGIDWLSQEALGEEWGDMRTIMRGQLQVRFLGSTWQSLMRREGTVEVDYLNGEIVRLAEQVGMSAPINKALTAIVMDMAEKREPPGRYTLEDLCAELGLSCT